MKKDPKHELAAVRHIGSIAKKLKRKGWGDDEEKGEDVGKIAAKEAKAKVEESEDDVGDDKSEDKKNKLSPEEEEWLEYRQAHMKKSTKSPLSDRQTRVVIAVGEAPKTAQKGKSK